MEFYATDTDFEPTPATDTVGNHDAVMPGSPISINRLQYATDSEWDNSPWSQVSSRNKKNKQNKKQNTSHATDAAANTNNPRTIDPRTNTTSDDTQHPARYPPTAHADDSTDTSFSLQDTDSTNDDYIDAPMTTSDNESPDPCTPVISRSNKTQTTKPLSTDNPTPISKSRQVPTISTNHTPTDIDSDHSMHADDESSDPSFDEILRDNPRQTTTMTTNST